MTVSDTPWYAYHENIITLTRYMAENGYEPDSIAYAVEKPWKYGDVFEDAQAEIKGEESEV